jgi:tRNA pseudouridine55 synthase
VDKPAGCTSHDVVGRIRRVLGIRAVGHTGTLDPFATGLLIVLVGSATRLARFVERQPKTYRAVARLGWFTATDDLTGEALPPGEASQRPQAPSAAQVEAALAQLRGPQRQRPPAFSAKQVGGQRSYRLARRGQVVSLPEVDVVVHRLDLVDYNWPEVTFRTVVSPGTYVRALGRDLGELLATGAHLAALRREAIGDLLVGQAVPLELVGRDTPLLSPLAVLGPMPRLELSQEEVEAVGFGRPVYRPDETAGAEIALVAGDRLVAVGERREGRVAPTVVLAGKS